jgi:hypothetical protein
MVTLICFDDGRCEFHNPDGGGSAVLLTGPWGQEVDMDNKTFKISALTARDGELVALGTFEERFLVLPITEEEAREIRPHLEGDETYAWQVEEDRVIREGEVMVAQEAQPA